MFLTDIFFQLVFVCLFTSISMLAMFMSYTVLYEKAARPDMNSDITPEVLCLLVYLCFMVFFSIMSLLPSGPVLSKLIFVLELIVTHVLFMIKSGPIGYIQKVWRHENISEMAQKYQVSQLCKDLSLENCLKWVGKQKKPEKALNFIQTHYAQLSHKKYIPDNILFDEFKSIMDRAISRDKLAVKLEKMPAKSISALPKKTKI